MRKSIFNIFVITLAVLVIAIFGGCRTAQNPAPNEQGQPARFGTPGQEQRGINSPGRQDKMNDAGRNGLMGDRERMDIDNRNNTTGNNNLMGAETDRKVKEIESQITAMAPVERATVIISGNTALVGVAFKDEQEGNANRQFKNDIEKKVKDMSPGITNVVVAESPDLYRRMENLSRDIGSGRAMKGLTDEFRQLVDRMTQTTR